VPESELVGRNFSDLFSGASEPVAGLIQATYRHEKSAPLVVRLDENQRVLRLTAAPLAGVEPGSAVILIEDVTEQQMLEAQIIQNDKMASIGQLVSGVAHELNNPLTSIAGLAELLLERPPHPELPREHLRVIHDQAERAGRIVRNLLTFARKGVAEKGAVDLNDVVTRTSLLIVYELQLHGIELDTELSPEPVIVLGDRYELQQVLLNLVINAEQAMVSAHGRGAMVIRTWHDEARDVVALEVSDDGPGVPEEAKSKIFDPFFTTKEVGKGTGLGLTVAYAIVQEHRGRIRVETTQRGAAFVVELPVSGESHAPRPRPGAPSMEAVKGASVLLVEDELALAAAVGEALTDAGLDVDHAGDGEEALARVRQKTYDVVICDLKMPRVDGMTLYRAIAAATPVLARRVIFVTGDVAGTDSERFLDDTGCRWLAKPFRLADLLRAVRDTLG
jgi:two-component system NtrC family sensor kinase